MGELKRRLKLAGEGLETVDDVLWDAGSLSVWETPIEGWSSRRCMMERWKNRCPRSFSAFTFDPRPLPAG